MYDESLKNQINTWLKEGIIEPSNSPYNFCILPVPKKNGKIRWVVDYRQLNKATIKDSYPLPHISDNLNRLSRSTIYSCIDGAGAFHVIPISDQDKHKTAFSTSEGSYQFARLPFGLANAPATYSRLVQKVLQGIPMDMVLPYLDDSLIHSKTLSQHFIALDKVLAAHKKAGLKLQPEKCSLFRNKVTYLGHDISPQGIAVCPDYIQIIKDWPMPATKKCIRSWVGKCSYYRKFIQHFSTIMSPFTEALKELPKESSPLTVTTAIQTSFDTMKQKLTSSPILAFPDFKSSEPFILDTDWSGDANCIGAVLSQVQDGQERVISYGARKLPTSCKKYAPNKGELAAVVYFLKHFRYFLTHRKFILRTDHQALKHLYTMEKPTGMTLRWLDILSNFDFQIHHRPGTKHTNADALSRTSHAPTLTQPLDDEKIASMHNTYPPKLSKLSTLTDEDPDLSVIKQLIVNKQAPSPNKPRSLDLNTYLRLLPSLTVKNGIVYLKINDTTRACAPRQLWQPLTCHAHDFMGHFALDKTLSTLKERFFFPGMRAYVHAYIRCCPNCQIKQHLARPQRHTFRPVLSGYPFQRINIDFVGPLPATATQKKYIFTIKCNFTRWLEAYPTTNCQASTAANLLLNDFFPRFGYPEQIHCDNGTHFTADSFSKLANTFNISVTHTPPYHAQSNPVERAHKDLGNMLRAFCADKPNKWDEFLPICLLGLRCAINTETNVSPFEAVFARKPMIPLDLITGLPPSSQINEYVQRAHQLMNYVRNNLELAVNRQRRHHYQKRPYLYQLHQKVWLYSHIKPTKLRSGWSGPWTITKLINPLVVQISPHSSFSVQKTISVSVDRIKPYVHTLTILPPQAHDDLQCLTDEFLEGPFDKELPTLDQDGSSSNFDRQHQQKT